MKKLLIFLIIIAELAIGLILFVVFFTGGMPKKRPDVSVVTAEWTSSDSLDDHPAKDVSGSVRDMRPVDISLDLKETVYSGNVGVDYTANINHCEVRVADDAPGAVRRYFNDYNRDMRENIVPGALKECIGRAKRIYEAGYEESGSLYLIESRGLELYRADSRVVSLVKIEDQHNDEQLPPVYKVFGETFDAVTGEELTLNDILTDVTPFTELLTDRICEQQNYGARGSLKRRIDESVRGMRDDGAFAFALTNTGIRVFLTKSFDSVMIYSSYTTVCIPFADLEGSLRGDAYRVDSNYIEELDDENVPGAVYRGGGYSYHYAARHGGRDYICVSDAYVDNRYNSFTTVYEIKDGRTVEKGSVPAAIMLDDMKSDCFYSPSSTDGFTMYKGYDLYDYYTEEVRAKASFGDDGLPVWDYMYPIRRSGRRLAIKGHTTEYEYKYEFYRTDGYGTLEFFDSDTFIAYFDFPLESGAVPESDIIRIEYECDEDGGMTIDGVTFYEYLNPEPYNEL